MAFVGAVIFSQPLSAEVQSNRFQFDPATCSFGATLDRQFETFKKDYDELVAEAGFKYRIPNAEMQDGFERHQWFKLNVDGLNVSAISFEFDYQFVYFEEDFDTVRNRLIELGVPFPEGVFSAQKGGGIADNAMLFTPEEHYVWDPATQTSTRTLYGKSVIQCELPEFKRMAIKRGISVEELARIEPNPALWSRQVLELHEKALAARKAGEFLAAAADSGRVVELLDENGGAGTMEYAMALDNHAIDLANVGRKREAILLSKRALDLSAELVGTKHLQTTKILTRYSSLMCELGDCEEAWWQLHTAYFQFADLFGEEHPDTIEALHRMGVATSEIARQGKDPMMEISEAGRQLAEAFKGNIDLLGLEHPRTLQSIFHLAFLAENIGDLRRAEILYPDLAKRQMDLLGEDHPDFLETTSRLAHIYLKQPGRAQEAIPAAEFLVRKSLDRRARLQTRPMDDAQRARDARANREYFVIYADALWSARESDPAKARENALRALQDALLGSTDRAVAMTAARKILAEKNDELGQLAAQRQSLSDEWQNNELRLTEAYGQSGAQAGKARAAIRQRQLEIESRIAEIDRRLQDEAPEYFSFVQPQALNLGAVQNLLREDEAVLLVVPGPYGTHAVAVSQDAIEWHRSDWKEPAINKAVQRLMWDVGANVEVSSADAARWMDEGEGAYPYDRSTAFSLYRQLVEPVANILDGKSHVFLSASGALSGMPFGLLVTETPEGEDGNPEDLRQTKWFADRHALVTIPSLSSLRFLREHRGGGSTGEKDMFIGFGDPVLEGRAQERGGGSVAGRRIRGVQRASSFFAAGSRDDGSGLVDLDALRSLSRLPGTAEELAALQTAFGEANSQVYLAEQATEGRFRQLDLSGAGVLAIATHGLLAGELQGNSEPGLVVTPPRKASLIDDGILTSSEIADLDLDADWVIMSACNTAAGDGSEGAPGLSGLARSFFFAGTRNLLASHWPVRDDVAARITVRTVEIGREHPELSRAQAFQRAIAEIRNDPQADSDIDTWAHPNAWAPFTLIGDR